MPLSRLLRSTLALLGLALAAVPGRLAAQAQATTGVIRGTITDSAGGGALVGAMVTLRNAETNAERDPHHERERRIRGDAAPGRHLRRDRPGARVQGSEEVRPDPPAGRDAGGPIRARAAGGATAGDLRVGGAVDRRDLVGERHPPRRRSSGGTAEQRPQHLQLHDAHAERGHRAGPGRRRDQRRRPDAASTTTSRSTAPTSTTRSSASSAAGSGRRSRSTSTRCRTSWSWPTAPTRSSAGRAAGSSTSSPSRAPTSCTARRTTSASTTGFRPTSHHTFRERQCHRVHARLRAAPVRRHARRAAGAGQGVLLPRLRPAGVQRNQADRPARPDRSGSCRASWTPARSAVSSRRSRTTSARSAAPTTPTPCSPSSTFG